jgi:hypothetical protein
VAISLSYQPRVDGVSGLVFGVEALARWTHPRLGPVPADVFISLAERTGLIQPLGEWVLDAACRQTLDRATLLWYRSRPSGEVPPTGDPREPMVEAVTEPTEASSVPRYPSYPDRTPVSCRYAARIRNGVPRSGSGG